MTGADRAHKKIAKWFTGDKLTRTLAQAKERCRNLDIGRLVNSRQLSRALRSAQYAVLMPLVEADLELFAKQAILYKKLPDDLERKLFNVLNDPDKIKEFKTDGCKITRNHQKAYRYYCRVILNDDGWEFDSKLPGGMVLFFIRNPLAQTLLNRVTNNFLKNLYTSISRVATDKAAIEACFLMGAPIHAITRIQSTGSDFHKGGQQVLIIDLAYTDGRGAEKMLRLVYKPSDVEFDYRIAGRNRPEFLAFLKQNQSDRGYPIGHKSLYEMLNDAVFQTSNQTIAHWLSDKYGSDAAQLEAGLELPTYAILPRYPGSRLSIESGDKGIRSSYGYIEYLEHNPENSPGIPPGTNPNPGELAAWIVQRYGNASERELSQLDWITRSMVESLICYRLWGRVIAIATVFQQTDLHHQNLRLRGRRPHVIDLENALVKTISGPNATGIPFNFELQLSGQIGVRPGYRSGAVPPVDPSPLTRVQFSQKQWSNSVLWLLGPAGDGSVLAEPVIARMAPGPQANPVIARQLASGLAEALRLMAQPTQRQLITKWISDVGLQKVIVRNVVEATGELTAAVAGFVGRCVDNQLQSETATLDAYCESRRKGSFTKWQDLGSDMQNPFFALNNAQWHGADFFDLDVPSYYQQVQSNDLLSSDGKIVTYIVPADAGQKRAERGDAFKHYLEKTGFVLLNESFAANLPVDEKQLKQRIGQFLTESKLLLPKANLDRILG